MLTGIQGTNQTSQTHVLHMHGNVCVNIKHGQVKINLCFQTHTIIHIRSNPISPTANFHILSSSITASSRTILGDSGIQWTFSTYFHIICKRIISGSKKHGNEHETCTIFHYSSCSGFYVTFNRSLPCTVMTQSCCFSKLTAPVSKWSLTEPVTCTCDALCKISPSIYLGDFTVQWGLLTGTAVHINESGIL